MDSGENSRRIANLLGLGRLSILLLASIVGVAAFWSVLYGVGPFAASAVVIEIGVILIVAFLYAWRSSR